MGLNWEIPHESSELMVVYSEFGSQRNSWPRSSSASSYFLLPPPP